MDEKKRLEQEHLLRTTKPETPDELHAYVKYFFGINLVRESTCPDHDAEFDYICHSFFKEEDCIVYANRGGGKTQAGAILTALEAIHKPGFQCKILGGSSEQSEKMYAYTEDVWNIPGFKPFLLYPPLKRKTFLRNGSEFTILTQSTKSVRGSRVNRLRCDEVDEFQAKVWKSVVFTTKSSQGIGGSLEILSTLHKVGGVMSDALKRAVESGTKIFKWCIMDVLEKCGPEHKCNDCILEEDCHGIAKKKKDTQDGFCSVRDAIQDKTRSDEESWIIEQLCKRPDFHEMIFPNFNNQVHVIPYFYNPAWPLYRTFDFGSTRDPFVCLWHQIDSAGNAYTIDEVYKFNLSPSECFEKMEDHEKLYGYRQSFGNYAEPAAGSYKKEFARRGTYISSKMATIVDGIHKIRERLKIHPKTGKPTWFISRRCVKTIDEFENFNQERLAKGLSDHCVAASRYLFVNLPRQIDIEFLMRYKKTSKELKSVNYKKAPLKRKEVKFVDKLGIKIGV